MTEQKVRTVMNAVPVTKTRTVQVCVPQTTMQTVTKDYGHWEEQVVEVPMSTPSYSAPAATMVSYGSPSCGGGSTRVGLFGRLIRSGCGGGCGASVSTGCGC